MRQCVVCAVELTGRQTKYCSSPHAMQAFHATHPDRNKESVKKWRLANPDKQRATQRRQYAANKARYSEARRRKIAANPEAEARRQHRAKLIGYGVTPEWFRDQLVGQAARCAVCCRVMQPGRNTHIDHDHSTGAVRALLCSNCNTMIGLARESSRVLLAGARYLASFA